MKKIKTVVIICICILAFPLTALAAEETYSSGHFYYHSHEGYVSICGYLGSESDVIIPDTMSGRPVSEIEDYAFDNCNSIKTITVSATVTMIGSQAFTGAPSLEKIISYTEGVNIVVKENVVIEMAQTNNNTDSVEATDSETSDGSGNPDDSGNSTDKNETGNQQENTNNSSNTSKQEEASNTGTENSGISMGEGGYEETHDADEKELDEKNPGKKETPQTSQGIKIEKSDTVVTVDENRHLITIDKSGNTVILDDTEGYTILEKADGTVVIENSKGEKITTDENGNIGIPGKTELNYENTTGTSKRTNFMNKIYIAVIVLVAMIAGVGIAYYYKKHRK